MADAKTADSRSALRPGGVQLRYGLPKVAARATVRAVVVWRIVLPASWVCGEGKRTWLGRRFDRIVAGPHRAACFWTRGAP